MQTVAILGVGLIGGSFALALRKAGFGGRVLGVSSPRTTAEALRLGVIDEALPLEEAVPQADLIYLAQPISRILDLLAILDPHLPPGALVTDAGSTKARIVAAARRHVRNAVFVGGHPMAGKETRGVAEAEAGLFQDRTYFLTAAESDRERSQVREFERWIGAIGARSVWIQPDEHDRLVALTSHLPQLAATALATTVARHPDRNAVEVAAGPGLIGATRLALSPYDVWRDILATNPAAIEAAIRDYIRTLEELLATLATDEIEQPFRQSAGFAAALRNRD